MNYSLSATAEINISCYEDVEQYANDRYEFYLERRNGKIPNIITNEFDLHRMVKLLRTRQEFAYDTETTGVRVNSSGVDSLVGISISWGYTHTYYVACGHVTNEQQVSIDKVIKALKPVFENPRVRICGHNLKFDMHVLANYGINIRFKADKQKLFDTMRACWLTNENTPNDLKSNSWAINKIRQLEYEEIVKLGIPSDIKKMLGLKANQKGDMSQVAIKVAGPYALDDAYSSWKLYKYFQNKLKDENLVDHFWGVDAPYNLGILFDKEREGIKVDLNKLSALEKKIIPHMERIQCEVYERLGFEFNMGSPKQMVNVVFEVLGFPVLNYTKETKNGGGGNPSAGKDDIEDLVTMFEFSKKKKMRESVITLKLIRDYRRLKKHLEFCTAFRENLYPDGKIHCTFKQLTVTGRLSCTDVNMQQVPDVSKQEDDDVRKPYNLREVFVADFEDEVIIAADHSNLELRILAHFCNDPNLMDAFKRGQDVHSRTALTMFFDADQIKEWLEKDPLLKEFKKEYKHLRAAGKTLNFGLIYGMQIMRFIASLSRTWKKHIPDEEGESMYNTYFEKMDGVGSFIKDTHKSCRTYGFVETVLGRKRRLPDIWSSRGYVRSRAERQSVNSIIQGSAADIVVINQLKISKDPLLKILGVKMLLQVHDEIVFKCKKIYVKKAMERIQQIMNSPFTEPLDVDLVAEPGAGYNWAEAKAA